MFCTHCSGRLRNMFCSRNDQINITDTQVSRVIQQKFMLVLRLEPQPDGSSLSPSIFLPDSSVTGSCTGHSQLNVSSYRCAATVCLGELEWQSHSVGWGGLKWKCYLTKENVEKCESVWFSPSINSVSKKEMEQDSFWTAKQSIKCYMISTAASDASEVTNKWKLFLKNLDVLPPSDAPHCFLHL